MPVSRRKNASIAEVIQKANKYLAREHETCTPDFRHGVIVMVEDVLFQNDVYAGFNYLPSVFEKGEDGLSHIKVGADLTRRQYYVHSYLTKGN